MNFQAPQSIEVRQSPRHDRGVFAIKNIRAGELIEESPVLKFPELDLYSRKGTLQLANYVFAWSAGTVGLALGFGSIYNHSYSPNAFYKDTRDSKRYIALTDIAAGEEITINYNGDPSDDSPVGFDVK